MESAEAVWHVLPNARIVHAEPVIHIVAHPNRPQDIPAAEKYRLAQYEAWDMLGGRMRPQLGGSEKYLDILGMNYYWNNQWIHNCPPITRDHPLYRPFRQIAREVYERYRRPLFIAETGIEDDARPEWLRYMATETIAAIDAGVPIEGLCLYPILCHPGWDDDRHCHNGLWDYADASGERDICQPLAAEIRRQQRAIQEALERHQRTQSLQTSTIRLF